MSKNFYITTPIYYPSDNLHIGHTYCTVAVDAVKRFKTLEGYKVLFTTGTDEHGQKIQEKAKEAGKEPLEYIDAIVDDTKALWKTMDIHYDSFVRSTDPAHEKMCRRCSKSSTTRAKSIKGNTKATTARLANPSGPNPNCWKAICALIAAVKPICNTKKATSSASLNTGTNSFNTTKIIRNLFNRPTERAK